MILKHFLELHFKIGKAINIYESLNVISLETEAV